MADAGRRTPGWRPAVGWAAAWAALAVALVAMPEQVGVEDVDAGWAQALSRLAHSGARFGVDTVFPYGPLGPLLTSAHDPAAWPARYWQELGFAGWTALLVVQLARRLPAPAGAGLVALTAAAALANLGGVHVPLAALAAAWRPVLRGRVAAADLATGPPYLAVLALAKFNLLVFAAAGLGVTTAYLLAVRPRWHAALPGLVFAAATAALWLAAGQRPGDFPAYLASGVEYARGYGDGMAVAGPVLETRLGLLALGLVAAAAVAGWRGLGTPAGLAGAALLTLTAAVSWKHGFVRHDIHALPFFVTAAALALVAPAANPRGGRPAGWLLAAAGAVALVGAYEVAGRTSHLAAGVPPSLVGTWVRRLDTVTHPSAVRAGVQTRRAAEAAARDLPRVRAAVGGDPVDALTDSQGLVLLLGLNLAPRPTIQGMNACSGPMLNRNAAHFAGPAAPRFVLLDWLTIDGRYPTLTDGPALLEVLHRYRPVLEERGVVLLERRGGGRPPGRVVADATVKPYDEVPVAAAAGEYLTLSLDVQPTLLGQLRSAAFRPPELTFGVRDAAGHWHDYHLPAGMARPEFLLDPVCVSTAEIAGLWAGEGRVRAAAVRVGWLGSARAYVRPAVRVTVRAYPLPAADR